MIAYAVTSLHHFLKDIRMFADVISDTEKSGLSIEFCEVFKDKFSGSGHGAVIKSQVYNLFIRGKSPC